MEAAVRLYERIVDPKLLVRRIHVVASRVWNEQAVLQTPVLEQLDMFTDYEAQRVRRREEEQRFARERRRQEAVLHIRKKYGKNAILKGMNLEEGATAMERNRQVGGHRA